jgi:hypothetical protein
MSKANEKQVGGNHYKIAGGEEHWDRAWRLRYDPFQYQITKYVERWRRKNGLQDLEKGFHCYEKYLELIRAGSDPYEARKADDSFAHLEPLVTLVEQPAVEERDCATLGHVWSGGACSYCDAPLPTDNVLGDEAAWKAGYAAAAREAYSYRAGELKPTSWIGFVFEGADSNGFLFTCKKCRRKLYTQPHENPYTRHFLENNCPSVKEGNTPPPPPDGEADHRYTGQN